ncbi:Uncharacterised protein g2014 [Pycnogonum litorale]
MLDYSGVRRTLANVLNSRTKHGINVETVAKSGHHAQILQIRQIRRACTLECNIGCFCTIGYVIKENGCVLPSDC